MDIETLLNFLALVSIPIGVFYHIMTLNNTRKNQKLQLETRQTQLFMHIYSQWYSTAFWENWEKVMEIDYTDYDDANEKLTPESRRSARSLFVFFEGIGVLVNRGLIEPSLIDDLMSSMVISFWEKWRNYYIEYRIRRNAPMVAEWIEYLYNTIKLLVEEQHPNVKGKIRAAT
jgi:hypothetical protein